MNQVYHSPRDVRLACRENRLEGFASDALAGYLCVNLVMMDKKYAGEFQAFCEANPVSCPLLKVLPIGEVAAPDFGEDLDLRTDLRSYDVIRNGENTGSVKDVRDLHTKDMVSFLIGSSVSLDGYLVSKGMGPSWGPCIYLTNVACQSVGVFKGVIAVTMRSYPKEMADKVAAFTGHFPWCHGAPLKRNDPAGLGIVDEVKDIFLPWKGGGWVPEGHDKLYWACGITPSLVARAAKLPLMIVHTPGNALLTDIPTETLFDRSLPS